MERKYYPFLISASPYKDYWTVICPEKIRPMVISKAAIRGGKLNQPYMRKIIFGRKTYQVYYCYETVPKKYMTLNEEDIGILKDNFGRNIQFFYGVFGINIPLSKLLLDESKETAIKYLPRFLNDKTKNFKVESKPFQKQFIHEFVDFEELEPLIIQKDVYIESKKNTPRKTNSIIEKEKQTDSLTTSSLDEQEGKKEKKSNRSSFGIKKIAGIALTTAGVGLSIYAKTISWISVVTIGAGMTFLISEKKENNAEQSAKRQ